MISPDGYYLSRDNPIATADQRDLEALALRIYQMPAVAKAREQAAQRWKVLVGRTMSPKAWALFDSLMEEYTYSYTLKAVNSDPNYPRVLGHLYGPPHEWFGMKVPGSRTGGGSDNPDNNYTIVPIDGYARFEIHGQRFDPPPADVPFQLCSNIALSTTLGWLAWKDIQVAADGRFVITLDPRPAEGRPNHIQTTRDSLFLLIRDSRSDWRQIPCGYRARRLDPPTAPAMTDEQMAARAAIYIVDDVAPIHFWMRVADAFEINHIPPPFKSLGVGGLATQMSNFACLNIADDEAYILRAGPGDAVYYGCALHDSWYRSLDYGDRTTCLSNSQVIPEADGSITYVISASDPGVHNWLDTRGFNEVRLMCRWQMPGAAGDKGLPWMTGELVKLGNLDHILPPGTPRVTAAERQRQLSERQAMFNLRFVAQ